MQERNVDLRRPSYFEDTEYEFQSPRDKGRNVLVLPRQVLSDLIDDDDTQPQCRQSHFTYVEATLESFEEPVIAYATTFETAPNEEPPKASARTNLQRKIGQGIQEGKLATVRTHPTPEIGPLRVYRNYSDETLGYHVCYLSETVRNELSVSPTDHVEVYNPTTGGRVPLEVHELRADDDEDITRLSGHIRQVLFSGDDPAGLSFVDGDLNESRTADTQAVFVRPCTQTAPGEVSLRERLLDSLVGYRELGLRVRAGKDRDEHRGVVRVSEDLLRHLAVEPGDELILEWNGNTTTVRCHLPPDEGTEQEPFDIFVPSTVRDQLDVSLGDALLVRRNMYFVFQKEIALSVTGILAAFFTILQLDLPPLLSAVLIITASILTTWFLFLPERRKCR